MVSAVEPRHSALLPTIRPILAMELVCLLPDLAFAKLTIDAAVVTIAAEQADASAVARNDQANRRDWCPLRTFKPCSFG